MKRVAIFFILFAALAAWFFFGRDKEDKAKETARPPVPVSVAAVSHKDMPLLVKGVGSVVAYETVTVRPRIESQVVEVHFKDGDYVKKGDVLFILDDRTLRAQVGQLEANRRRDAAQLENARVQFERAKELTSRGFDSEANLDAARAAYEAQQATVSASGAEVENARVQLGYTRVTAPISGRTGTINITTGNTVHPTDTLVTINQVQPIRVHTSLPQSDFYGLREALGKGKVKAEAVREDNSVLATGELEYIDNAVDVNTGTFAVRAAFANRDETLWPGMFATLLLTLGIEKDALVIPEVAMQHGQTSDYVFVIEGDKAHRRDIKVSRVQNSLAVVSDGLKEGEQVATDGLLGLKEGSTVTVRSHAEADGAPVKKGKPGTAE